MLTADYYGKIQILGNETDGYVLSNGTACLSELGASHLLNFSTHSVLNNIVSNNGPKEINQLIDNSLTLSQTVIVTAECRKKNSPIKVYTAKTINVIARAYATAYLQGKLRKNQSHIGLHCAMLRNALADVALEQMIYDACRYRLKDTLPQRIERAYIDAVGLIQELGFTCSAPNQIAIKKDLTKFLKVPESTLNSFLRKHSDEIKPIQLDRGTIRSLGCTAKRMNGYLMDDVGKIAFGMDSEIGIELKKRIFGQIGSFAKPQTKDEIQWRKVLSRVFEGFDLHYNYPIGDYRVDFFVAKLMLALECNGYCHRYYNPEEEAKREKVITERYALVRFHHKISLETLCNGILQAKPGQIIRLYDLEHIGQTMPLTVG
jgi:very-short-patch-repair endonuclease